MSDLRIQTPVDLSWIDLREGFRADELALLRVAGQGENPFALELEDVAGQMPAKQTVAYLGTVRQFFFRRRIRPEIERRLGKKTKYGADLIARMLRECGGQITDLGGLRDTIFRILDLSRSSRDKAHLIYCAIIALNARDINRQLLHEERPPLMKEFERAAETILGHLGRGVMRFDYENRPIHSEGRYDASKDCMYLDDVSRLPSTNEILPYGFANASTILHELWHFYQDSQHDPHTPHPSLFEIELHAHVLRGRYVVLTQDLEKVGRAHEEYRDYTSRVMKGDDIHPFLKLSFEAGMEGGTEYDHLLDCAVVYLSDEDDGGASRRAYEESLRVSQSGQEFMRLWSMNAGLLAADAQRVQRSGANGERITFNGITTGPESLDALPEREKSWTREVYGDVLSLHAVGALFYIEARLTAPDKPPESFFRQVKELIRASPFPDAIGSQFDGVGRVDE